ERGIWQRRYWEHQIRDDDDMRRHIDYIHYNPVKHGHVTLPIEWPYSSLHWYIRNGHLSKTWGTGLGFDTNSYGEVWCFVVGLRRLSPSYELLTISSIHLTSSTINPRLC